MIFGAAYQLLKTESIIDEYSESSAFDYEIVSILFLDIVFIDEKVDAKLIVHKESARTAHLPGTWYYQIESH